MCLRRTHGFDLRMEAVQGLERAATDQRGADPNTPERDVRLPQAGEIKHVPTFGRYSALQRTEMFVEQADDLRTSKVIDPDVVASLHRERRFSLELQITRSDC